MCGRTACTLAPDDIVRACTYHDKTGNRKRPEWKDPPGGQKYWTSYNIAPTSHTPVLVSSNFNGSKLEADSERVVIPMKWGLTPSWHKGDPYKVPYETNNCRAEGMLEKRTYKVPLQKGNRCVVLADGYFEWKTTDQGKQPYFFYFPQPENIDYPAASMKTEKTETLDNIKKEEKQADSETQLDRAIKQEVLAKNVKTEPLSHDVKKEAGDAVQDDDIKIKSEIPSGFKDGHFYTSPTNSNRGSSEKEGNKMGKSFWDAASNPLNEDAKENSKSTDVKEAPISGTKIKYTMGGNNAVEEIPEWKGHKLLTMAGVCDVWHPQDDSPPLYSYSIITVSASPDLSWCHHRMPAILSTEEEIQKWLDSANIPLQEASLLIKPYTGLKYHPVSKSVNSSRFKSPDCIKPVELGKRKETPSSNMMMNWLKSGSPAKMNKTE